MSEPTPRFVGLDVHKDSIAVAHVRGQSTEAPVFVGEIGTPERSGEARSAAADEDGALGLRVRGRPDGLGVYRHLTGRGLECQVIAPSLIPKKPGDKVKTNKGEFYPAFGFY
jgi:hypothetical protein